MRIRRDPLVSQGIAVAIVARISTRNRAASRMSPAPGERARTSTGKKRGRLAQPRFECGRVGQIAEYPLLPHGDADDEREQHTGDGDDDHQLDERRPTPMAPAHAPVPRPLEPAHQQVTRVRSDNASSPLRPAVVAGVGNVTRS